MSMCDNGVATEYLETAHKRLEKESRILAQNRFMRIVFAHSTVTTIDLLDLDVGECRVVVKSSQNQ